MLDDARAVWWYERAGQQAGPVTAAALGRLVAEGGLSPSQHVWKDGMAAWQQLSSVAELAEALGAAAAPTVAAPPPSPPPPPFGGPGAPPPGLGGPGASTGAPLEEIAVGATILLSIVTLGIYGWVRFHQTGAGYEALAGRRSEFGRNFWLAVGLGLAGVLLAAHLILGLGLAVASAVFGYLTLSEALVLRAEALRGAGIQPSLTSEGTHRTLYVLGALLSFALVGLVLLLVQAVRWFEDWNAVVQAIRARDGSAPATD